MSFQIDWHYNLVHGKQFCFSCCKLLYCRGILSASLTDLSVKSVTLCYLQSYSFCCVPVSHGSLTWPPHVLRSMPATTRLAAGNQASVIFNFPSNFLCRSWQQKIAKTLRPMLDNLVESSLGAAGHRPPTGTKTHYCSNCQTIQAFHGTLL